jgi:rhamnogalacturonan endolyase
MKMYRNEFPVAQDSVSVIAGRVTTKDIASTEVNPPVIWRIGSFDGQPFEFKNGDKIERMHPSDVRMSPWGGSYTVGQSSPKDFPMALFAKQGGVATVTFTLAATQAAAETVLRIGTTLSFKGGRPSVKINNWQGKDPGAPVCPGSPIILPVGCWAYRTADNSTITEVDRFQGRDAWGLSWVWGGIHLGGPERSFA